MQLTFEEQEKLLDKATKLYNEIKGVKIKKEIQFDLAPKYYDKRSRYASYGFKYYTGYSGACIYCSSIKDLLEELSNYINSKKTGVDYIDNKYVGLISKYTIDALLDFVYYGNTIVSVVKKTNEDERKELNDLLS